jgi:hypothetical protein
MSLYSAQNPHINAPSRTLYGQSDDVMYLSLPLTTAVLRMRGFPPGTDPFPVNATSGEYSLRFHNTSGGTNITAVAAKLSIPVQILEPWVPILNIIATPDTMPASLRTLLPSILYGELRSTPNVITLVTTALPPANYYGSMQAVSDGLQLEISSLPPSAIPSGMVASTDTVELELVVTDPTVESGLAYAVASPIALSIFQHPYSLALPDPVEFQIGMVVGIIDGPTKDATNYIQSLGFTVLETVRVAGATKYYVRGTRRAVSEILKGTGPVTYPSRFYTLPKGYPITVGSILSPNAKDWTP